MVISMFSAEESREFQARIVWRIQLAGAIATIIIIALVVRLWVLQVVNGPEYRRKSETNRIETIYIAPPRGYITDRYGKLLVSNRPSYNLEVTRENVEDFKSMWKILAPILDIEGEQLEARFKKGMVSRRRYESTIIARDISREVVAQIVTERFRLPGVRIVAVPTRDYLFGALAAQTIGYTREINDKQLGLARFSNYRPGDTIGQGGVEHEWEGYLQGARGRQEVIVNAAGWRVGELSSEQETIGNSVETTLDLELQNAAEEQIRDKSGAIVALNVHTGEVLAIASSPGFDPNVFGGDLSQRDWSFLSSDRRLLNRATQGTYPPGSIFKPVLAIAGLAENLVSPEYTVKCSGSLYFAGRSYRCWKKGGHGVVNLRSALKGSCDVYFYSLGQRLGIDRISKYANSFGLGEITGIGLGVENRGLIPSKEWKRSAFSKAEDKIWFPGETLSVAIGQGAVTVTPLQMARAYAALVNGGMVIQPRIIRRVNSREGHVLVDLSKPNIQKRVLATSEELELVKQSLSDVVNAPGGTGRHARLAEEFNISVGGKTGTAQVVDLKYHGKKGNFEDHAWFVGFAPVENSEIVVAALIEHGGHGGASAAPVVQAVMTHYFARIQHRELLKNEISAKQTGE